MKGKTALVTGATSGMGRSAAIEFGRAGCNVVVAGRRAAQGEETAARVREAGGQAIFVATDVADPDAVKALVDRTVATYGKLHFAFNNAGITGLPVPIHDADIAEWRTVMATNLDSIFYCMKYELAAILATGANKDPGGAAIVNHGSVLSLGAWPNANAAYVTSKHGLHGLTQTAAVTYAAQGIRVNTVCSGIVETEITRVGFDRDPARKAWLLSRTPIGRLGHPDEVGRAVVFLCSEAASLVNGAAIPLDGGATAVA